MADNLNKLQHAQAHYQCLAEATFEGIVLYRGEDIVEVNPQFADMFGYTVDELVGSNCIRLVAPQYKTLVQDLILKEQLGHPVPERLEVVGVHKDGHWVDVELRSRKIDHDIPYRIAVVREV